jgi:hypothetical protein
MKPSLNLLTTLLLVPLAALMDFYGLETVHCTVPITGTDRERKEQT